MLKSGKRHPWTNASLGWNSWRTFIGDFFWVGALYREFLESMRILTRLSLEKPTEIHIIIRVFRPFVPELWCGFLWVFFQRKSSEFAWIPEIPYTQGPLKGGFKRGGFPIWTCPSFFVLFCPFSDFPDFSGIFPICAGMVRGFSRFVLFLFLSLLRAPTRNSPERVRDTIWTFPEKSGKHPGLETPRFSFSQYTMHPLKKPPISGSFWKFWSKRASVRGVCSSLKCLPVGPPFVTHIMRGFLSGTWYPKDPFILKMLRS